MTTLHSHAITAQNQLDQIVERLCNGAPMTAELRAALRDIETTASFMLHQSDHMRSFTPQYVAAMTYRTRHGQT